MEIKPCVRCGGTEIHFTSIHKDGTEVCMKRAICNNCGSSARWGRGDNDKEAELVATVLWNDEATYLATLSAETLIRNLLPKLVGVKTKYGENILDDKFFKLMIEEWQEFWEKSQLQSKKMDL